MVRVEVDLGLRADHHDAVLLTGVPLMYRAMSMASMKGLVPYCIRLSSRGVIENR